MSVITQYKQQNASLLYCNTLSGSESNDVNAEVNIRATRPERLPSGTTLSVKKQLALIIVSFHCKSVIKNMYFSKLTVSIKFSWTSFG